MRSPIPAASTCGEKIHFTSGGDSIPGYLARPSQPGSHPGIVVIHEAFGLVEHIRDIARRFANIGYNALAPDLYARAGGPSDPNDINTVLPVMFGLPDGQAVQDLEAAAAHLRSPGATGKIGAIGFCSGGRHTLLFACSSSKVARRSMLGRLHPSRDPGRGNNGGPADPGPRPGRKYCTAPCSRCSAKKTRTHRWRRPINYQRAVASGKNVTTKIYKNAGHEFLADYRPSYPRRRRLSNCGATPSPSSTST